jgi:ParB/RepB/Spo0J family partition protein
MSNLMEKLAKRNSTGAGELPAGQAGAVAARMQEDQLDRDAVVLLVSQIEEGDQARKTFKNLDTLAASIKEHKQLQPIIVTQISPYRFKLAYGARRLRAIRDILKQDTILARVKRDISDATSLRMSQLAENIHRDEYEPMELADEFESLIKENGWTQDELAAKVHVSKSWISKKLSLLKAPQEVQDRIRSGELAETEYFNNKEAVKAEIATAREKPESSPKSEKALTLAIPFSNAIELASLVVALAKRNGLNEIELSPEPTKKELLAILARADDVKGFA